MGGKSRLPLYFERNAGQTSGDVRFLAHGPGYALLLTETGAVIRMSQPAGEAPATRWNRAIQTARIRARRHAPQAGRSATVRIAFAGARPSAPIEGLDPLAGRVNYFLGNNPTTWHRSIATYARVRYRDVWPGIDAVYYGSADALEYDLVVAPRADPNAIRLEIDGARPVIDRAGDVVLQTAAGRLKLGRLRLYQDGADGTRQPVAGSFAIVGPAASGRATVAIRVASYDRLRPLVIDPQIVYSTYLGGSGGTSLAGSSFGDAAADIAIDSTSKVYLIGTTYSTDFPVTVGPSTDPGSATDTPVVFVAKLNPAASGAASLIYVTYLGGTGNPKSDGADGDEGNAIAVDGAGDAYVAGLTYSGDFPTSTGALQRNNPQSTPDSDSGFVAELSPDGSTLIYSTFLGGNSDSEAEGIALAPGCASGCQAYVAGDTLATDFPTQNPYQSSFTSQCDKASPPDCSAVAFAAVLAADGSALTYATFLGGTNIPLAGDGAEGIAVAAGSQNQLFAYVTGFASSNNFPVTSNAAQTSNRAFGNGEENCFITKLDPAAGGSASLVYSTYLGGTGTEENPGDFCNSVVVDGAGDAFVTGLASSTDFPVTSGAFQRTNRAAARGGVNGFVTEAAPDGSSIVYSTLLGGSGGPGGFLGDAGADLALDSAGNIYVTGATASTDFPTTPSACQTTNRSTTKAYNAFISELDPAAATNAQLVFSTYFGGSVADGGNGISLDQSGNIYVAGYAQSSDLEITPLTAFQPIRKARGGNEANAFLVEVDPTSGCPRVKLSTAQINFSAVGTGNPPVTRIFTIKNMGKGALQGSVGSLTAPFAVTAGVGNFNLSPGQTQNVQVQFAPVSAGKYQQPLQIISDDVENSTMALNVTGTGEPGVLSVKSQLNFGKVASGKHKTAKLTVKNVGLGILVGQIQGGTSPPFAIISGGGSFSLKANAVRTVALQFSPQSAGTVFSSLLIVPNGSAEEIVTLKGTGMGK
jgi:hypothetical protein